MKTTLFVVTIALLLSLAGNWYQWDSAKSNQEASEIDRLALGDIIEAKQAAVAISKARVDSITKKLRERTVKDSIDVSVLKGRVSGLRQKLAELGEITPQEVADTTCARLIHVSQLKDSVIQRQDELISTLEQRHIGQILDLQAIIKEKTSQIMSQIAVSETLGQVVTNLEQDVKREKRKKNFFKVVSGVLAGGIVFLSLKE